MSRTNHHGDKKKEKLFGKDWNWIRNKPKTWRKIMKHKKRRVKLKQALFNYDKDKNNIFPLDTKPWQYYFNIALLLCL
jgi:hypothetical protein